MKLFLRRLLCSRLGPARTLGISIAVAAALLSVLPREVVPPDLGTGIGDKAMHGVLAAFMAFFLLVDSRVKGDSRTAGAVTGFLVLATACGELVQPAFGRSAEWSDWIAAAGGIVLARCVLGIFCVRTRYASA